MDNAFLVELPQAPGVYRIYSAAGDIIYVGKARNLKKRVTSYFQKNLAKKTAALMAQAVDIQYTIASSENEALLLESNLIKAHQPRYNILLRDDKSYPYLFLSTSQKFPRLQLYRGEKKKNGRYFGPYPSAYAVKATLHLMQKLFKLRQCDDAFFRLRSRPCLQYQIGRCSAPCVGHVTEAAYAEQIHEASLFLEGKNDLIIQAYTKQMEVYAEALDYENAARMRDQIVRLRKVQSEQFIESDTVDTDIIALAKTSSQCVICLLCVRQGRMLGHKTLHPKVPLDASEAEVLSSFVMQYYLGAMADVPRRVVLPVKLADKVWIESAFAEALPHKVQLTTGHSAKLNTWREMAFNNARHALLRWNQGQEHLAESRLATLSKVLGQTITRIECFDISHTQGEATVASCVVYGEQGALNDQYRRFNIRGVAAGDDYQAIAQVVERRYSKLEFDAWPELILIDGGKGQLAKAHEALMRVVDHPPVLLLSVAKGSARKLGLEQIYRAPDNKAVILAPDSEAMHLIQYVRDESHRFAITGHRKQRAKARRQSVLEDIPGVGVKRRRALLNHFGGMQMLKNASITEIAKVDGVSVALAKKIYDVLR